MTKILTILADPDLARMYFRFAIGEFAGRALLLARVRQVIGVRQRLIFPDWRSEGAGC